MAERGPGMRAGRWTITAALCLLAVSATAQAPPDIASSRPVRSSV